MTLASPTPDNLRRAAELLRAGGVIGMPTDTVYGIGAVAQLGVAVARLYVIKGRPENKPIAVLVDNLGEVDPIVSAIPPLARRLAERFWPGALTLVLPARALPTEVTAGGDSVGVRAPNHLLARELIRLVGRPLAVTSANLSGEPPLTTGEAVERQFGDRLDLVIDGVAPGGEPSTVLDLTGPRPRARRIGAISLETLGVVAEVDS